MFYVYILYSIPFDKYYIGHTDDLESRIWSHNNTERKTFTSKYRPWVYGACFAIGEDRSSAMAIEKRLKSLKSKLLLQRIVFESYVPAILAQSARVPNYRL